MSVGSTLRHEMTRHEARPAFADVADDPDAAALAAAAGPELVRDALQRALGERYVRVQTPLGFGAARAFDDASPGNLEALRLTAEDLVARERPALARLAGLLAA